VTATSRRREVGRGERVLPGVFRLRLPLPWPGVPHGNAWAIAAGDGVVLVDTGIHEPGSMGQLERALDQVGLRLEHVRLLVCTHAHADHYGQAATIVERTGCELWMHPRHEYARRYAEDP
jgi:glyoxylase-like metal-dependent hydrolase (beta-lactamase superfamily II)